MLDIIALSAIMQGNPACNRTKVNWCGLLVVWWMLRLLSMVF